MHQPAAYERSQVGGTPYCLNQYLHIDFDLKTPCPTHQASATLAGGKTVHSDGSEATCPASNDRVSSRIDNRRPWTRTQLTSVATALRNARSTATFSETRALPS